MATSVRSNGRKVRLDNNNRGRVGEFFQHLAIEAIGGQFVKKEEDLRYGDIADWKLRLGVEVKSSDNGHPFRIRIKQKRTYEEILFPLDCFAYCLCSYRNRVSARKIEGYLRTRGKKAKTMTLLHRFDKKSDQFKLLSQKVDDVFLLDIEVMNALEKKMGIYPSSHPGRQGEQEMRLRRRDLRPLVNGSFSPIMTELGLDPKDWVSGKYLIEKSVVIPSTDLKTSQTYNTKFVLYTIFRKQFHKKFVRARRLGSARIQKT